MKGMRDMAGKHWEIAPLLLGTTEKDKSQVLLHGPLAVRMEGAVLAWLLISGDDRILVDTGLGKLDTADVKSRFLRTPEQFVDRQLMRFDTTLQDIPVVINTHLHHDHCGGNEHFKNARLLVQKKELEYALNPLPVHEQFYAVDPSEMKFELLDGEAEIAPGVKVMLTPGHSPGSQSVLVDTSKGLYVLVADAITHFENMSVPDGHSFRPGPIYVDLRQVYESLDRLKNLRGTILPGHDPQVLQQKTYP
jgi:glyoxylase-like metal-dependent hydrolase (beta-lactamase superfamily II)